jgi:hypothetical protein
VLFAENAGKMHKKDRKPDGLRRLSQKKESYKVSNSALPIKIENSLTA